MARFSERDRWPVDALVERWRDECLVEDGSLLFAGEQVWTAEHAQELVERFNERQLEDARSFDEKLTEQLADASRDGKLLMTEVIAVYLLFSANVGGTRKRELVSFVLGLAGEELPEGADVRQAFDTGIGGPGQAFNSFRPSCFSTSSVSLAGSRN